jgi:hypothetical protein
MFLNLIILLSVAHAQSLELQKVAYQGIDVDSYCVRLMDSNKIVGCQGNHVPNSGILWRVQESLSEFQSLKEPLETYILVLKDIELLNDIVNDQSVAGVIVLNSNFSTQSNDKKSPNHEYGLYQEQEWNSQGRNILDRNYKFPVMFIGDSPGTVNSSSAINAVSY